MIHMIQASAAAAWKEAAPDAGYSAFMMPPLRTHFRAVALAASVALLAPIAIGFPLPEPAQPPRSSPAAPAATAPAAPPAFTPAELREKGLTASPLQLESLGLTVHLPLDSQIQVERIDNTVALVVSDAAAQPTWRFRMQSLRPPRNDKGQIPPPWVQIASHLATLKDTGDLLEVLADEAIVIGNREGHKAYIRQRAGADDEVISGWVVLPSGEETFFAISITAMPSHWKQAQPLLEASLETIQLRSPEAISLETSLRIQAGRSLLESFDADDLKALVGRKQWARIYQPQPSGTVERGYSLIEIREGKRGELNPARAEEQYTRLEREPGLLVHVQGRVIVDAERKTFYDSIAIYWMSWDMQAESWSVRGTYRQGDLEKSEAETGLRDQRNAGAPILHVIKTAPSAEPVSHEWEVPDSYLPQALGWVIGRLMPRDITEPREYAYYFYVSGAAQPKVYQRIDEWGPARDGSGNWALTTRLTPETPPFTAVYRSDGTLVRRTQADGTVTEPIELAELHKLWRSKGLPVSSN